MTFRRMLGIDALRLGGLDRGPLALSGGERDKAHDEEVARIAGAIKERAKAMSPVRISRGGADRAGVTSPESAIDISALDKILAIDPVAQTATVEPGVTFAELARETLRSGLLPEVVAEPRGATVGGAIAGFSVDSTSHRCGGLHDTCIDYEMIDGEGEVITLSRAEEPLLFDMIHGSRGTLGVLTKVSLKLARARQYVGTSYTHFSSFDRFHAEMLRLVRAGRAELIDGIVHGPGSFVLCEGRGVDAPPYVSRYRWLDVFHESTAIRTEDYLPTLDYCFRYDSGGGWMARRVPLLSSGPVRLAVERGRRAFESESGTRLRSRLEPLLGRRRRPDVACDALLPLRRAKEFYTWYERVIGLYPLWIVPYRMKAPYPWIAQGHAAGIRDELLLDFGIHGRPATEAMVDPSDLIEHQVYDLGGVKALTSPSHAVPDRFWSMYNRRSYESAKRRLDPDDLFGGLYDACHTKDSLFPYEEEWMQAGRAENRVSGIHSRGVVSSHRR